MIRTSILLSGAFFLSLSACVTPYRPRIDPRVAASVEVSKYEPSTSCGYVGPVKGSVTFGDLADAHGDVLRNAVLGGGNYVAVDLIERPVIVAIGGYTVRGRLFSCPVRAEQAPMSVARADAPVASRTSDDIILPKAICEPDCSPGFTCLHAMCVSACNPTCAAGEQCGADRMCRAVSIDPRGASNASN